MVAKPDDDRLESLRDALEVAGRLAQELNENQLLTRLVNVFSRMPEGDREIVVGVLEREVSTRVVSQAVADDLTKVALRPNPSARCWTKRAATATHRPAARTPAPRFSVLNRGLRIRWSASPRR